VEILSLCVSVLALIIASAAYYRSCGKQDLGAKERALDEKIQRLSALAQRATDGVVAAVRAGYEWRN
jgi:hypothetical protein